MPPKPPLPGSKPTDALRLCLLFWVELIGALLALLAVYVALEKQIGKGAVLTFVILGAAAALVCIGRLVRKVISLRNQRGPMREKTLAAFWTGLLLPLAGISALTQLRNANEPYERRQAEAKQALGRVAGSEATFRKDYGRYTFNVKELGFPESEGVRAYVVGFPTACSVKEGATLEKSRILYSEYPLSEARKLEIEVYLQKARLPTDCKDPKDGFEAYAVGVLRENAPLDVWRIDEAGKLENLQRGF